MPIVEGLEQQTPEWIQMRIGIVTGSRVPDVMAKLKRGTGEAAARRNYRNELVIENLTGRACEHYVTQAMEWGIQQEKFARNAYEVATNAIVEPVGFALHPKIGKFGASPDSLVGDDGVLEIKCPTSETHLEWMLSGVVPVDYEPQMLAEMACTERKWCDFVSYDPRMPDKLQLYIRRLHWDDEKIAAMEQEVCKFLDELADALKSILHVEPIEKEVAGWKEL